jgi:NADPH:quinone reductase-like Zn-dependent oxidoreductase
MLRCSPDEEAAVKAALFYEHGSPGVLRVEDVPRPEPGPREVRLRVAAAALNHLDLWVRRGLTIPTLLPHIGGADIAGTVDAIGAGVTGVQAGDRAVVDPSWSCGECAWCERGEESVCTGYRIIGEHTQGGFAEYVIVPARNLFAVPVDYPLDRAAAAPLVFLTAWRGLITRGRLARDETVLITGASGGVATAAIQIARHTGARVYAVTTSDNVERVRALGADVVYDREQVDYSQEVWADTGKRGVDVIFDSVGEATWRQNMRAATRLGRIVVYGGTTGPHLDTDVRQLYWRQLEIIGTTMSNRREFAAAMELVFSGELQPIIDVTMPIEQIREAHERLEKGEQFGKIVVVP